MAYDTDKNFDWMLDSMRPKGQVVGAAPQELPHIVTSMVNPVIDSLGWQRYGTLVFETASALNNNIISLTAVPSGNSRLYPYVSVRAAGGAAAGVFWFAITDGTNPVAVSEAVALVDGQAASPPKRPIIVPAGFFLQARSDQLSGALVTIFIEAYSILLNDTEYVLAS